MRRPVRQERPPAFVGGQPDKQAASCTFDDHAADSPSPDDRLSVGGAPKGHVVRAGPGRVLGHDAEGKELGATSSGARDGSAGQSSVIREVSRSRHGHELGNAREEKATSHQRNDPALELPGREPRPPRQVDRPRRVVGIDEHECVIVRFRQERVPVGCVLAGRDLRVRPQPGRRIECADMVAHRDQEQALPPPHEPHAGHLRLLALQTRVWDRAREQARLPRRPRGLGRHRGYARRRTCGCARPQEHREKGEPSNARSDHWTRQKASHRNPPSWSTRAGAVRP
jgi:hypothetical protein